MAGTAIHNKEPQKLLGNYPKKGLLRAKRVRPTLEEIVKALKLTISVDGADIEEIEGGFHIRITSAASQNDSWRIRIGSESDNRIIGAGVFGGNIMPEINGVRLDETEPPELDIADGVINYIYLRCQFTKSLVESFVADLTIAQGDVTVVATVSPEVNVPSAALAYVHLATIDENGVASVFWEPRAIDWRFSDTGDDTQSVSWSFFQ